MTGTGVEGLTVVRRGTTVLRDVTLLAEDGELLVVLGSSGSGKSTLLRVIAGLENATSGEVLIKGRRVTGLPSGKRHVGMVLQGGALIPFLDVARNLGWGLKVQHRPDDEVQERVASRARQLGLSRVLPHRPGSLSGGERGLVSVGRALVQTPDVFLLDEPLGDLDAVQRVEVRRQIVDVVRSLGITTLYVTHDPDEGLVVADRVAVLHEGAIVQVGPPRELYEQPVNLFVAEFLGTPGIGLLPARLVSSGERVGFQVGARTLPLWQPVPPPLIEHVGRDVVLGLRGEDVHDAEVGGDPDAVTFDAVVTAVEYTGRQNVVALLVEGATLHALYSARAEIRIGNRLRIAIDAARAHVFEADTGRAIWHPEHAGGA